MVVLLGRNGCGKTTLLRTLGRFLPPQGGAVYVDEQPAAELSAQAFARLVSIVTTERIQTPYLTVYDLIALGRQPYLGFLGRLSANDQTKLEVIIELLDLSRLRNKYLTDCSDGEQQLALLGRALAQDTPVILLDEATAHLDFVNKVKIFQRLQDLAHVHHKLLFLATHELSIALKFADRALLFAPPELLLDRPDALLEKGQLQRVFATEGLAFPFL